MKVKKFLALLLGTVLSAFLLAGCSPQPEAVYPEFDASQVEEVAVCSDSLNPPGYTALPQEEAQNTVTWLVELTGVRQNNPKPELQVGTPVIFRFTQTDGSRFYLIFHGGENYNLTLQTQDSDTCYNLSSEQCTPWSELAGRYYGSLTS